MSEQEPSVSVVILAYNESENVTPVLAELCAWLDDNLSDAELIFVDDGSSDDTATVARAALFGWSGRSIVVRRDENGGMGAGLKTGTLAATGRYVTFLPADGQVPPSAVGALYGGTDKGLVDVVLSLYEQRDDGAYRKLLSFGVRALIQAVHGVNLKSEGPYMFKRSLFDEEQLAPNSFFLNFEFPIRALRAGLEVSTVVVPCRPRLSGQSKTAGLRRIVTVGRELGAMRARRLRAAIKRTL